MIDTDGDLGGKIRAVGEAVGVHFWAVMTNRIERLI